MDAASRDPGSRRHLIGLDVAKDVFHVHGADRAGHPLVRKVLRRAELTRFFATLAPCTVGMEACATAHHWARELSKPRHGCSLIPARHVKAYLKTNKNDLRDAEAICEAVQRPTCLRRGQTVTAGGPVAASLARAPDRTTNSARQLHSRTARRVGVYLTVGSWTLTRQVARVLAPEDERIPPIVRSLSSSWSSSGHRSRNGSTRSNGRSCTGIAVTSTAATRCVGIRASSGSAVIATIGDAKAFKSARHFAAWLGWSHDSSPQGAKRSSAHIQARRWLSAPPARSRRTVRAPVAPSPPRRRRPWLDGLLLRRSVRRSGRVAHKNARTIWRCWPAASDSSVPIRSQLMAD